MRKLFTAALVAASIVVLSSGTAEGGTHAPDPLNPFPVETIVVPSTSPTTFPPDDTSPPPAETTTIISDPPESHMPPSTLTCRQGEDGRYRWPDGRFCRSGASEADPVGSGGAAVPVTATPTFTG